LISILLTQRDRRSALYEPGNPDPELAWKYAIFAMFGSPEMRITTIGASDKVAWGTKNGRHRSSSTFKLASRNGSFASSAVERR